MLQLRTQSLCPHQVGSLHRERGGNLVPRPVEGKYEMNSAMHREERRTGFSSQRNMGMLIPSWEQKTANNRGITHQDSVGPSILPALRGARSSTRQVCVCCRNHYVSKM